MLSWALTLVLRRAKSAPLFFAIYESLPPEGVFVTLVVFAYYYNLYAQFLATFFLTSCRFSAVIFPLRHSQVRINSGVHSQPLTALGSTHSLRICRDFIGTAAFDVDRLVLRRENSTREPGQSMGRLSLESVQGCVWRKQRGRDGVGH